MVDLKGTRHSCKALTKLPAIALKTIRLRESSMVTIICTRLLSYTTTWTVNGNNLILAGDTCRLSCGVGDSRKSNAKYRSGPANETPKTNGEIKHPTSLAGTTFKTVPPPYPKHCAVAPELVVPRHFTDETPSSFADLNFLSQ